MNLSNLKAPRPNQKNKKRIGRGQGSGKGGHTVGRGHKGQKSRTGYKEKFWFEGGQMPLQRRIPKFGFKNPFKKNYQSLNVDTVQELIEAGKLNEKITFQDLVNNKVVSPKSLVKLLGRGEIEQKVEIEVHACSQSAKEKIEKAGGTISLLNK